MKNRWQDELRRELKPVRVDDSLKMRILAEAAAAGCGSARTIPTITPERAAAACAALSARS